MGVYTWSAPSYRYRSLLSQFICSVAAIHDSGLTGFGDFCRGCVEEAQYTLEVGINKVGNLASAHTARSDVLASVRVDCTSDELPPASNACC